MKRAVVCLLSLMLLVGGGLAGCSYSNGSGSGGTSSTAKPGY